MVIAGGCAAGSGGVCLAGGSIIVGLAAGLGGSLGGAVGSLVNMFADQLTPVGDGDPTPDDKRRVNEIGERTGCMTCGAASPGTKTGNWPVNHVPPRRLRIPGEPSLGGPHCLACQNAQGGTVNGIKNHGKPVPDPHIIGRKHP
jgi:hypothetical protein